MTSAIVNYDGMSEDEIDLLLGTALLAETLGGKPPTDEDKRATAKAWFDSNLSLFSKSLCERGALAQRLLGKGTEERNLLIGAVLDALLKVAGVQIPVALLTAKILHYGLQRLCSRLSE